MSFVGKLAEFRLSDLLQIIAANEKNGKLSLTRSDAQGVIVLRGGKIIYAASSSARETLGNLLFCEGLIDEEQLLSALEQQHQANQDKRLGTILVDAGVLEQETLERIVRQQLGKVVSEFVRWETGFFKFELVDLPNQGEIEVDAADFLLRDGLAADQILLDIERHLEALESTSTEEEAPTTATSPSGESDDGLSSLKSVMAEIRSPEFTGEVTLEILNFARRVLPRAVLFFARQGNFTGMSHYGIEHEGTSTDEHIRRIKIPSDQPSVLARAAGLKSSFRGSPDRAEWDLYLISQLGGFTPTETVAVPLIVNQTVLLVLYGDNAPEGRPIGPLHELELLMLQAGLAMEKRMLEKRVEQYNKLRGEEGE
ncbi:MAG: DUF4388 domain-containing protein [Acidobacteriota bacterium]|nr:DUF4388 domain-containing protein [Acidobacteriota bacterium]